MKKKFETERKTFGWILIIFGLLGVFYTSIMVIVYEASLPIYLLWDYIFLASGYRFIKTEQTHDPIPTWIKIIVYFLVCIGCMAFATLIGSFVKNIEVASWLWFILFIICVETNLCKKWMLDIYYKKYPEEKEQNIN